MKTGATRLDKQQQIREQNDFFMLFCIGLVATSFLIAFLG